VPILLAARGFPFSAPGCLGSCLVCGVECHYCCQVPTKKLLQLIFCPSSPFAVRIKTAYLANDNNNSSRSIGSYAVGKKNESKQKKKKSKPAN